MSHYRKALWCSSCLIAVLLSAGTASGALAAPNGNPPLSAQGMFFSGGHYVDNGNGGQIMKGQMYVSFRIPTAKNHKTPIIMIHGGGQTGTNFEMTPDGREGWAGFFLDQGYAVYIVDQPTRARSAYHPATDGPLTGSTVFTVEHQFTAPETFADTWPQAHLHTQWPGTGLQGDPAFDQFYASQVEGAGTGEQNELNIRDAVSALLDKIGPAIVLTHSQSGPYGWVIADDRPTKVKAILALEPGGPPFENAIPPWSNGAPNQRPWGVTFSHMTYSPPISNPSQLNVVTKPPEGPDLVACKRQADPARQLTHLLGIPILIFTGEASYHAGYDYCTAEYLQQAGASAEYVRTRGRRYPRPKPHEYVGEEQPGYSGLRGEVAQRKGVLDINRAGGN